jgi:hypothetical protein
MVDSVMLYCQTLVKLNLGIDEKKVPRAVRTL